MQNWTSIDKHISASLGRNFNSKSHQTLHGGCINAAWRIANDYSVFFIKLNSCDQFNMFASEFIALQELYDTNTIRIPSPICYGKNEQYAYLVTEYLELDQNIPGAQLGEELSALHNSTQEQFGWQQNNTIGSTPQINRLTDNWVAFWQQHRLGYQLELAWQNHGNKQLRQLGEQLLENLAVFFSDYSPKASLLHGDLWSGNVASHKGEPVIFDPASYYGDREADIAMTELFGGFPADFYNAYESCWPLDPGYSTRKHLYNLYHLLNHLNLFGSSYLNQCLHTTQSLLAHIR